MLFIWSFAYSLQLISMQLSHIYINFMLQFMVVAGSLLLLLLLVVYIITFNFNKLFQPIKIKFKPIIDID